MNLQQIKALEEKYVVNSYKRTNLSIKSGKGATCQDYDGKNYIDFGTGIGVNALGFCDSDWVEAICSQAHILGHVSNLYYTMPGVEAAKLLCEKCGMSKVFFANSGAEADEGMIKAARKYSQEKYGKEHYEIITLENSFHGRTITTLAATGQEALHKYFTPFTDGFQYAKANDIDDLKAKISDKTAGIMIELIQGEGGVLPLNNDYVQAVAKLCAEKDILFLIDEVQTGVGRTGHFYCYQAFDLKPDIVSSAKGLGGGLPIGAVLFNEKTKDVFAPGDHASTFGMNPIICAGVKTVIEKLDDKQLDEVAKKGEKIKNALLKCSNVDSVTGMGLMIGIMPKKGVAAEIMAKCIEKGLIVLTAKDKIRLLPPLTISEKELDDGIKILIEASKNSYRKT